VLSKNIKIKIYRTIKLPLVMYGCETLSLTLREERRLRVFENRLLRRIFEPKKNAVTGQWRKQRNEEINDLCCSPNNFRVIKSRRMRWAEHLAGLGERRGIYKDFVGKPEVKRPLGRPRRRWKDNIKIDIKEGGMGGMDWIELAATCECGNEPSVSIKWREFLD
jgi:hypothetical protein